MRRIVVTALLLSLALPAAGADCLTLTLDDRPGIAEIAGSTDLVRVGVVGTYLWVQTGENTGGDAYDGTISHPIPIRATSAEVCTDGSVLFTSPDPEPLPDPTVSAVESDDGVLVLHPGGGGPQEF